MDMAEIIQALDDRYDADSNRLTIQDVNTARSVADLFIYGRDKHRTYDAFDMGIRVAVRYMHTVRRVHHKRLLEDMGASSGTLYDYFNRAMQFVETGKAPGRAVTWDGVVAAAIRNNAEVTKFNVVGNIGTAVTIGASRIDPRITASRSNLIKPLYTAPLSMNDAQLIFKWVSHPGGFVEMLLFVARMVEICFQADER
ncbi:MAG: hypothetical protein ACRDDY_13805 [Clostridium sp.]|uniref:hypothetical protein n=1 Tax=Clostridium sp. TaxID=1506 RepID=UPI003EE4305D